MRINLIPQEEKRVNVKPAFVKTLVISFLTFALLSITLGARYFLDTLKLKDIESQNQALKDKEDSLRDFKETFEKYRSHPALNILENHTYFSKLFDKLNSLSTDKIKISNIQVDESFLVTLGGQTQDGIAEVSRFLKTLKKEGFLETTVKSMSTQGQNVNFSLAFKATKEMVSK